MPFVFVWGVPLKATPYQLDRVRQLILLSLSSTLPGCPEDWIRPIIPVDRLSDPRKHEGAQTIFVELKTGLFQGMKRGEANKLAPLVTKALADEVSGIFSDIEVECSVVEMERRWTSLVKPKQQPS